MRSALVSRVLVIAVAVTIATPLTGQAQILKKLKDTVGQAAEDQTLQRVDQMTRLSVDCVFNDLDCIQDAEASGDEVVLTDEGGNPIVDDSGAAVEDPDEAADVVADRTPRPGEGAWANYDFVPGDEVLFYDDYSDDNVGDFPRHMEFVKGNWEIVEWNGRRLLRNTGPRDAAVRLRLPESLPETFTIEMEVYLTHPNHQLAIFPGEPSSMGKYDGQFFYISPEHGTGVKGRGEGTVESTNNDDRLDEELISVRFMVDGTYVKAYVGERRVANAPNVTLPRPDVLQIHNTYSASEKNPILIGTIRVAGGGRDLYDVLEEQGRVTTRGILFAVNSDRIRAESTGTLLEIGTMLQEHPGLDLSIEGHTDSDGDEAFNQDLSERRAAAVKDYLVSTFGIEEQRLETAGFGESVPVADNDTPEGKQENRRVELVRLGA